MINWTLSWKKSPGGVTHKSTVNAASINAALADFHVERQRVDKLGRDDYAVIRADTNHRTNKSETPQSYLASELPPRNPTASGITLTIAAEIALMKRIHDRKTADKKGANDVG